MSENKVYWTGTDMNTGICGFREIVSVYADDTFGTLNVQLDDRTGRWYRMCDELCIPERCYVIYNGKKYTGLNGLGRLQAVMYREKIAGLLDRM